MAFMDEQMKLESQIGFTIGILIGALGAGIVIIFFTELQWYWKVLSAIGEVGIIGNLAIALQQLFKVRKQYIEMQAEMKKLGDTNKSISYAG